MSTVMTAVNVPTRVTKGPCYYLSPLCEIARYKKRYIVWQFLIQLRPDSSNNRLLHRLVLEQILRIS